jgi:pimeloyl-ACP methyl ester carboxylesterase
VSPAPVREGHVEHAGSRLRYLEAGEGAPLVHLQAAGELRLGAALALLSRHLRVIALEMPGSRPSSERAAVVAQVLQGLGLERFNVLAAGGDAATAVWLALEAPGRVLALVLESPTVIADGGLERRLAAFATPTLVLVGTRDDVPAPTRERRDPTLVPSAHVVFVYDAGHAVSAERPEAFADVALDFLERHEAFVISRAATVIHP